MEKFSLALCILAFGILINSCNDPSPIGSELLEEDQVDVFYSDSVLLVASTIQEDSVLAFDPNPNTIFDNFVFGDYNDPVFGKAIAGIYAQLIPGFDAPSYGDAELDSIVLTLQYDSSSTYGIFDNSTSFGIGVYRITGDVDIEADYYSNQTFEVNEAMPLAEVFDINPQITKTDSIKGLINYQFNTDGDTIDIPASIRIKLSDELAEVFFDEIDSLSHTSNNSFVELFQGIHVRPLSETSGMLSFNLSPLSASRLSVYYKQDTLVQQYNYNFSSSFVQFSNFDHDFEDAVFKNHFDDTTFGDSLLFIQAMSGPNIKIEIPNTSQFDNVIINKAEIIFTVAQIPEDMPEDYPPMRTMIATDIGDDGAFAFIPDVISGGGSFGGVVRDAVGPQGELIQQYRMNISSHFQRIVDGDRENAIYLRAFPKQERASRSVIFGPGHSKYPMKLNVTYTKLN